VNSDDMNLCDVTNDVRTSTKNGLNRGLVMFERTNDSGLTHASCTRNSAVNARCSRPRLEDKTPP